VTESVVRLVVGTLTLAGAAAGAVGAPQPGAAAAKLSAASGPLLVGVVAGLLVVLALLVVRRQVVAPAHAGKHRA
jgi:hypothetical protein